MTGYCTWKQAFVGEKGDIDMFFILYWYLFNKPDYQGGILKTMEKLKKSEVFKDLPKSLDRSQDIMKYIHKMEKNNLIGRDEMLRMERNQRHKSIVYLQVLSFFYLDLFCIMTPNMKGRNIDAHYEEYEKNIKELGIPYLANPIEPLQKILQEYSTEPDKFMKKIVNRKWDHLTLYELIGHNFLNLYTLFFEAFSPNSSGNLNKVDYDIINEIEAKKLINSDKSKIIDKYDYFGVLETQKKLDRGYEPLPPRELFELFVSVFTGRIMELFLRINTISGIYRKLDREEISEGDILPILKTK